MANKKAIILLSGGLDSATCLAIAKKQGFDCHAISFLYGQRSEIEVKFAKNLCEQLSVQDHHEFKIDLAQFGGSSLTDKFLNINPENTYVPARNTIFLSIALGWAEVLKANHIFIGVNAIDYNDYPDCRPDYITAYEKMANLGTKSGNFKIHTPLLNWSKARIIQEGIKLGLDYSKTCSCYNADIKGHACGNCPSCKIRAKGFHDAGIPDPTVY